MSKAEGLRRAQKGMERVARKTSPAWKNAALASIMTLAVRTKEFTVNDVWEVFKQEYGDFVTTGVHNTSAIGPVMQKARQARWCQRTNRYRRSHRSTNHGNPEMVWRSLIYKPQTEGE